MAHNTKYNQISFNTMMIDKREMPWAYNGNDPHEPRFIKPSHHDCHCNPANVASEGFVHRAITDHNHAHNSHYDQFRRVYDRIEQVRKMQVVPEAIEIIDEFGKIKSRVNADLTAVVNGHEKRILTSDDDRQYGERFYLHNKQLEELEDKLDEIIAGGTIIPAKTFTFDSTDFDVSTDDVVSLKKGEISENSRQVITGHDVYSVVTEIDTRLSDFQDFYKQNSFYHFTECEVSDIVDGLTNVILKPFTTSTIPPQLTNIRINIDSLPIGIDSGVARNMVMVIPATNPTTYIEWPSNFYPKTSQSVDYQYIAGVENVYWISEFSPNKFVVSGWQAKPAFDYLNKSVVFTSETDNSTISMQSVGDAPVVKLETSFDGLVWTPFIVNETVITLPNAGDKVYVRATPAGNNAFATSTVNYNKFVINGRVSADGNIMVLLNATEPSNEFSSQYSQYCFTYLFQGCTSLTSAPKLPATTLSKYCYYGLFQGCTSLTTPPELPSLFMTTACYSYMFDGCSSLTRTPELPATTLASSCYSYIFQGCSSITTPTTLPANTLFSSCYSHMYDGCSSLREAPALPVTILVNNCYSYMFQGCTSLTSAPELPATVLANYCYRNMFQGCTSLTSAPTLPATALATSSYESLFQNCTALNIVITNQTTFNGCDNWLDNVSPNGSLYCSYKLGTEGNIERGASACPTNWVVESVDGLSFTAEESRSIISMQSIGDAPAVELETSYDGYTWTPFIVNTTVITLSNVGDRVYFRAAANSTNNSFALSSTDYNNFIIGGGRVSVSGNVMSLINSDAVDVIPSNYCFARLFQGCALITSAPELPATVLTEHCYNNMFQGCTSLTSAPELPATVMVDNCYKEMFKNCSSLNSLTTNQISFNGCDDWLVNVSTNGTLYCLSTFGTNTTITRGSSACPNDWNVVNTDYLCFTAELPDSSVSMKANGAAPAVNLIYSSAGSPWTPFIVGETVVSLPNIGDKVYIKADTAGNAAFASSGSNYNNFVIYGRVAASGNIMSLLNSEERLTTIPTSSCFISLFKDCSVLTTAPELPATAMKPNCYSYMFQNCKLLSAMPELPATILANYCYRGMFWGCTTLTTVPLLPATTLASSCYGNMFQSCSSIKHVRTRQGSFTGCSDWLSGVAAAGTFECLASLGTEETIKRGTSGCPEGWIVVNDITI